MRQGVVLLSFIIVLAGFATVVQPSSDDIVILAGNQAEVPTWLIGDWWEYELGGGVDAMDMTISATGSVRFEVTEIMTQTIGGTVYHLYNVTLSGSFTGSGSGSYGGVDFDVDIDSASLGGYWWFERGDLAVIADEEIVLASGNVTVLGLPYPLTLDAEIENAYSPSREDFDFPIELGDEWGLSTDMTTSGYVHFFIDIPMFPIEDTIPLNNVTTLSGTSQCTERTNITVPAGTFDSFEASMGGNDVKWYSEEVGFMVNWESSGAMGLFSDLWVNLTSYNRVPPSMNVEEYLLPEKVNLGGNVTVAGNSTAPPFSTVNIKLPITGLSMVLVSASGSYSINISAPSVPDNTPTPTDFGSHGVLVEIIDGGTKGYAVRTLTLIKPDLYVLNISFSPTPSDGNPTDISAEIHCSADVGVTNEILVSFEIDGLLLGTRTIPQLSAGSFIVLSQVWVSSMGAHDVTATVDPFNAIEEVNETNNSITVQVFVLGPDLTPTNISVENSISYFFPTGQPYGYVSNIMNVPTGDFVNITTNVTNVGLSFNIDNDTGNYSLKIVETFPLMGAEIGPPLLETGPMPPLSQGESHGPFEVTWETPLVEGMHYFNISVIPYHNSSEMTYENNTFALQFNVVDILPDLYTTPSNISFDSQPYLGKPTIIYADIHANTNRSVKSSFVVSFLSDGQVIANDTISSIDAGGIANASIVWIPDVGTHTIRVEIDPQDFVGESDETNNSAEVVVNVPMPDLVMQDILLTDGDDYFYQDPEVAGYVSDVITTYTGQAISVSLNVTNLGFPFYDRNFRVEFYETDGFGGAQLPPAFYDSGDLTSLDTGESHGPLVGVWNVVASAGNYFVNLTVDVDDVVPESSESNNTFILRFEVLEPENVDYIPLTTMTSPVRTSVGKQVNLTSRVKNLGNALPTVSARIVFYEQGDPSTLLHSDTISPLDGGVTSASVFGFDWTPPGMGTFVITIVVDYHNDIPETNETNNSVSVNVEVYDLPVTTLSVGTPRYSAEIEYVKSSTIFELSAIDYSGLGIDSTFYRIDGSAWHDYFQTGNFTIDQEGLATVEYYSVDMIGGEEQPKNSTFFVDDTPPVTNLEYPGTQLRPSTDIELNASDSGSGVASSWYRINNGTWERYSLPFFLEEGSNVVEYYSIDNLGNSEHPTRLSLKVISQEAEEGANYKPVLSVILAIILLVLGLLLCRRKSAPVEESENEVPPRTFDTKSFILSSLPFVVIELLMGGISAMTGLLSIPPTLGEGLIVDIAIFVVGLIATILWNRREATKTPSVD